jgi:hypothetical protein
MTLRLEAIDPTTGAPVAGVSVADVTIYGRVLSDDGGDETLLPVYLQSLDV